MFDAFHVLLFIYSLPWCLKDSDREPEKMRTLRGSPIFCTTMNKEKMKVPVAQKSHPSLWFGVVTTYEIHH